jgi:hypothetical protein
VIKFSLTLVFSVVAGTASAYASAAITPAPATFVCPVKFPVPQKALTDIPEVINAEMTQRFEAVQAAAKRVRPKDSSTPVEPALMTALAQVAGCAALIDKESSCSIYFSPEVGDPLSIFMEMKKTAPLRKQFEEAIKALPNKYEREAAQHCIKLTGGK